MKKVARKLVVCLMTVTMSLGMASCGVEDILGYVAQWMPTIIQVGQQLLNKNGGTLEVQYVGTANLEIYDYNADDNTYDANSKEVKTIDLAASIEIFSNEETPCVTIKTSDFAIGSTKIGDFSFTTYWQDGKIDAGEEANYLTGGLCTYNGNAETAIDACAIQGTYDENSLNLSYIYIQVGSKLIMGTFSGYRASAE